MALSIEEFCAKWAYGFSEISNLKESEMKADLEEMMEAAREEAYPKE